MARKLRLLPIQVDPGDVVGIKDAFAENVHLQQALNISRSRGVPVWLELDPEKPQGKVLASAITGRSDDADSRKSYRRTCIRNNWREIVSSDPNLFGSNDRAGLLLANWDDTAAKFCPHCCEGSSSKEEFREWY